MAPTQNKDKKDKTSVMSSNSAKIASDKVVKSKTPFRYAWQKKGRFVYQEALLEAENADSPEGKSKQRGGTPKQFDGRDDGAESGEEASVHPHTSGKQYTGGKHALIDGDQYDPEESDAEVKQEDSDGDYAGEASIKKAGGRGRKKQKYEMKSKQPDPNGRVPGRKLVMWHRPHMVDKLMLHLQYECHRAGIKLPWDKVVERLSPGSSGQSALQHLNKLRDILISEGHMVPPLLGKASVPQDPTVRGYIRDMEADKPTDTRVVRWGEHIEDRKDNLQDVGVVRGSGNYRRIQVDAAHQRGLSKALEKRQQATGEVPIKKEKAEKPIKKRVTRAVSYRAESLDPAALSSDAEYDPTANKKMAKPRLRSTKPVGKYKVESDDETIDDGEEEEIIPARVPVSTPQKERHLGNEKGQILMTPPATTSKAAINSMIVKLKLRPDLLRRLASRDPKALAQATKEETEDERYGGDMENNSGCGAEDLEVEEDFDEPDTPTRQNYRQTLLHSFAFDIIQQRTGGEYQGIEEHGTRAEYMKAINNGTDPKVNGLKYKLSGSGKCIEHQTSAEYKIAPPPAYDSLYASHGGNVLAPICPLGGSFDASSAVAVSGTHKGRSTMNGMSGLLLDQIMSGMHGAVHLNDPFSDGTGSTAFSASGLPALSYNNTTHHGQPGTPAAEYNGNGFFGLNTSSSTLASASGSGNNSTDHTTAPPNLEINDDEISTAHSSPAPYAKYIFDGAHDDKESQEYMMEMQYF